MTEMMKELQYGKDYQYAHDYKEGYSKEMEYLPRVLRNKKYYQPKEIGFEKKIKARLEKLRGE